VHAIGAGYSCSETERKTKKNQYYKNMLRETQNLRKKEKKKAGEDILERGNKY